MKAAFHTLGCKVNQYETEAIKEAFVSRGAEISEETSFADIYVINSCSVTNMADRKSRQFIRRARRINPDAVIAVTGCYAQTAPEELADMREVDLIIGNSLKTEIADRAIALYKLKRNNRSGETGAAENKTGDTESKTAGAKTVGIEPKSCDTEPNSYGAETVGTEPKTAGAETVDTESKTVGAETGSTGNSRRSSGSNNNSDEFITTATPHDPAKPQYSQHSPQPMCDPTRPQHQQPSPQPMCDPANPQYSPQPTHDPARPQHQQHSQLPSQPERVHVLPYEGLTAFENMGIVTAAESSMCRAYIKIEEGCNRFCSYCLIPYARGRVRSRCPDDILAEAKVLIAGGCREIVLTGINTALYGTEPDFDFERLPGEEKLSGLEAIIRRLDALEGDFRIRLSSLEPTVVSKDDVLRLLGYSRLCHHVHLSVQSGSNKVLRAMNRRYTRDEYIDIVKAIRDFDSLYGITTDIIVGFPGETESDFRDSLEVTERSEFGKVHVFRYSPRRGTPGEHMPDAVPGEVKNERAAVLESLAEKIASDFIRKYTGLSERVLVEEINGGYAEGYTGSYIKVYLDCSSVGSKTPEPGEFCEVIIDEPFRDGALAHIKTEGFL